MTNDFEPEVTDVLLDRLVDGEIPSEQYAAVLAALESEPDGWRRCALAFLEAQAFKNELEIAMGHDAQPKAATETTATPVGLPGLLLSMAASFALAFALGALVWRGTGTSSTPVAQQVVPEIEPNTQEDQRVGERYLASGDPVERGQVTLLVDHENGVAEEIELPLVGDAAAGRSWVESHRYVPRNVQRGFRRLGFQVERDAYLAPVELGGGQRVFVPMGETRFIPISGTAFQ